MQCSFQADAPQRARRPPCALAARPRAQPARRGGGGQTELLRGPVRLERARPRLGHECIGVTRANGNASKQESEDRREGNAANSFAPGVAPCARVARHCLLLTVGIHHPRRRRGARFDSRRPRRRPAPVLTPGRLERLVGRTQLSATRVRIHLRLSSPPTQPRRCQIATGCGEARHRGGVQVGDHRSEVGADKVVEAPFGVEGRGRVGDNELAVEDVGACGRQDLAQLGLGPNGAEDACAGADDGRRLSAQRIGRERAVTPSRRRSSAGRGSTRCTRAWRTAGRRRP